MNKNILSINDGKSLTLATVYQTNIAVDDILKINTSTGDVKVVKSDAGEIEIKTSTGDIEASFLTEKVFVTSSSTGDIRVPESYQGGKCKLTTSTGDITVKYVK